MSKEANLPIRIISLRSRFLDSKVRPLLVSLALLLVLYPFFNDFRFGTALLSLLVSTVLLAGLSALSANRKRMVVGLFIAIPALAAMWGDVLLPSRWMHIAALGFMSVFYAYIIFIVLSYVLRAKEISTDEIFGAICVYLLIGVLWATIYAFIETAAPGSFYIDVARYDHQALTWNRFLYYSFVTLTSTGYGDITPINPHAQSLAILEVCFGVLYVAVLVARLVGLYSPRIVEKQKPKDFKLDEFIKNV